MKILRNFNKFIIDYLFLLIVITAVSHINVNAQTEAYFVLKVEPREETFVVKITDPVKIQMARDILSGKIKERYGISGEIVKESVCYNAPWSFHLASESLIFFQVSAEVCDSELQGIEDGVANGTIESRTRWCPWSSLLLKEIPAPNCSKYSIITVNAASYRRSGFAADSIVSAFGQNLSLATAEPQETPLPVLLAGSTVRVKDSQGVERMAQMLFASPTQVNYLIPKGTAVGMAEVTIINSNGNNSYGQLQIVSSSPDIFAANTDGKGVAAALVQRVKSDGSMTYEPISRYDAVQKIYVPVPIDLGADLGTKTDQIYLAIFGTGLGQQTGVVGGNAVFTTALLARESPTIYAGPQNFYTGLDQVNILLPRTLIGLGELNLQLYLEVKNIGTNDTVIRNTNIVKINVK